VVPRFLSGVSARFGARSPSVPFPAECAATMPARLPLGGGEDAAAAAHQVVLSFCCGPKSASLYVALVVATRSVSKTVTLVYQVQVTVNQVSHKIGFFFG
jgi:replication-associated recombination protein RarA